LKNIKENRQKKVESVQDECKEGKDIVEIRATD